MDRDWKLQDHKYWSPHIKRKARQLPVLPRVIQTNWASWGYQHWVIKWLSKHQWHKQRSETVNLTEPTKKLRKMWKNWCWKNFPYLFYVKIRKPDIWLLEPFTRRNYCQKLNGPTMPDHFFLLLLKWSRLVEPFDFQANLWGNQMAFKKADLLLGIGLPD